MRDNGWIRVIVAFTDADFTHRIKPKWATHSLNQFKRFQAKGRQKKVFEDFCLDAMAMI